VDEYDKRTVRCDVDGKGYLSNLSYFAEKGEFSAVTGPDGNIYVADGEVYVFDEKGEQVNLIRVPERPSALTFGGEDGTTLFTTGRSGFYRLITR
jgi:sugar lactone lactonase YvrE